MNEPIAILATDPQYQIDTGWKCCVCGQIATVNGCGFTWCWYHWRESNMINENGKTIKQMIDEL